MLVFGGRSAEHDVSRETAGAVGRALDPEGYEVVPVAINIDGQWLLADEARELIARDPEALPAALEAAGSQLDRLGGAVAHPGGGDLGVDVVLPVLHGPYGEDGTIQGLLELADLPYVGSGVVGSAVGTDKVMMKRAFSACGLRQANYLVLRDGEDRAAFASTVEAELQLPCFVKPANMGSSVGVNKAHDRAELDAAIEEALEFDEWIVAEEFVAGREIEVGVLGDAPPEASVPGEVVPAAEFYTYADKYEAGEAQLLIPAPLDEARTAEVRALAIEAFAACRCEAMARVDFFFEEDGRGFVLNELNTIPGFTRISMYPKLWDASGLPYDQLLDRLIELAIERHARRTKRAGHQRH
jgi:D-alanine-D-alanine ligase